MENRFRKETSMRLFAIRDDDVSFFTNWQDLDRLYANLWGIVPISFAVIPFAVPHWDGKVQTSVQSKKAVFSPLHENADLVNYLRMKVQRDEIEIMMHGYSHEYRIIHGRRVGEYLWKPKERLIKETIEAKRYLEELFHTTVQVFVPPSNMIGKAGIIAIEASGLHLSGIMGKWADRPISLSYLKAYIHRWTYRCLRGRPYPFPLVIGNHVELVAYSLTPKASLSWLHDTMKMCYKIGAPFVLATHHWELLKHHALRKAFTQLVEEALTMGYTPAKVSRCMGLTEEVC